MPVVQAYEELGVEPTATVEEIHAAYVGLARRFHPDRVGPESPGDPDRMARINAAWALLRDPDRRAALDASLPDRPRSHVRDPGPSWTPLNDDGVAVDDLDDTPTGARPLPRSAALLPATLFTIGVIFVMLGIIVDIGAAAAVGGALVIAAAVAFVALPVLTMISASRAESRR